MYAGEIVEYGTVEDVFDSKRKHHPYTEGLFRSIPDIHVESRRLHPIDGLMPEPTALPDGCKFHPRCPYCTEACTTGFIDSVRNATHEIKCNLYRAEDLPGNANNERGDA